MNKGHIYFEIQADDTKRGQFDFYSQVFGWKFSIRSRDLPIAVLDASKREDREAASCSGLPRHLRHSRGTNAFVCSLEVENFDVTAQIIQKLGGIVALPKFAVPNTCWQGYFIDPEGNTFGIFQVDPKAG